MKLLTKDEVMQRLKATRGDTPMAYWSSRIGISRGHLYEVLRGSREPGPKVLDFIGVEAVKTAETSYRLKKRA